MVLFVFKFNSAGAEKRFTDVDVGPRIPANTFATDAHAFLFGMHHFKFDGGFQVVSIATFASKYFIFNFEILNQASFGEQIERFGDDRNGIVSRLKFSPYNVVVFFVFVAPSTEQHVFFGFESIGNSIKKLNHIIG